MRFPKIQFFIQFGNAIQQPGFQVMKAAIPPALNHAKDLNIYEWNREPKPGVIEFLGCPITEWDFIDSSESQPENEI